MIVYWNYVVEKKYYLTDIAVALLLMGISGMVLLPHVMEQWSRDRTIGVLHVLVGIILGLVGIARLLLMARKISWEKEVRWKQNIWKFICWYLIIQILAGILQGLVGVIFYRTGQFSYDVTKAMLYMVSGIWQNVARVWFLFLGIALHYEKVWKEAYLIGIKAEGMTVVWSIITMTFYFLKEGAFQHVIGVVWNVVFLVIVMIYFGAKLQKGETA